MSGLEKNEMKLQCSITAKPPCLLVNFVGVFNGATLLDAAECQDDLLKAMRFHQIRYVAMNLQGVSKVDRAGIPAIQRIRKAIKEVGGRLLFCAVAPNTRADLLNAGVVGLSDFAESFESAVIRFSSGN